MLMRNFKSIVIANIYKMRYAMDVKGPIKEFICKTPVYIYGQDFYYDGSFDNTKYSDLYYGFIRYDGKVFIVEGSGTEFFIYKEMIFSDFIDGIDRMDNPIKKENKHFSMAKEAWYGEKNKNCKR